MRWRKCSPRPASSIGARQAAFTSRARAPGRHAAPPASNAASITSYASTKPSGGSPATTVRPKSEQYPSTTPPKSKRTGVPSGSGSCAVEVPESRLVGSMPVKMCVENDGVGEPARRSCASTSSRSSAMVTPGCTRGVTAAIACSTVRHARPIAASSSGVLTRRSRLTSDEPVRSRSSPKMRPSSSVVSAHTRSPTATLPRAPRPRATRSNTARPSSVSSTTTTSPSGRTGRSKTTTIRGRTKTGSASGRKNPPATQLCGYELCPKKGVPRSTPERYSRSDERPRKRRSTLSERRTSDSRRRRSA